MSKYHDLMADIKECQTEQELLKITKLIIANAKKWKLDEVDLDKLEQAGISKFESIMRERNALIKNKKQGFNNFD